MTILILVTFLLILSWQLMKIVCITYKKHQDLKIAQKQLQQDIIKIGNLALMHKQNRIAYNFYDTLGHSIAELNIQLQVAHKLWQVDPTQAQRSLSEAYQLSTMLMQEVRQAVRILHQNNS